MTIQGEGPAPYAPPKTVIDVITRYRDRGLSKPFTQDVLARAGVPESLAPRVLQSLRLLDLIDEAGDPQQQFEDLARASQEEFQARFAEVIRTVYADVFLFADPAKDEPERVRDAFRAYSPRGQQERMVTLFLGLCQFAGIIDEMPKRPPSQRPSVATTTRPSTREKGAQSGRRTRKGKGTPSRLGERDSGASVLPLLESLIGELPEAGEALTDAERTRFKGMFASLMDYYFPEPQKVDVVDSGHTDQEDEGSE